MKKLCLLMMLSGLALHGQDSPTSNDAKRRVVFGLKGGFNYNKVYDTQGDGFVASARTGYAAGAWVALPVNRLFGVQPELMLVQKGFKANGTMFGEDYVMNRITTHLDVPAQLQFKPFSWLSVVGGLNFSFLLSKTDRFDFGLNSSQQKEEFANSSVKKNVMGLIGGVDLNFSHIVVSGRAGMDLQDNRGDGSTAVPRYKNMWIQGTIGYRFY